MRCLYHQELELHEAHLNGLGSPSASKRTSSQSGTIVPPQDVKGNTALHHAVDEKENDAVALLLEAGAVPTVLNSDSFSPIHMAARNGFLP